MLKKFALVAVFILPITSILGAPLDPAQPAAPSDFCGSIDGNHACYAGSGYTECTASGNAGQRCWDCGNTALGKPTCITVSHAGYCSCKTMP